mgnify:CR=1 FL=1
MQSIELNLPIKRYKQLILYQFHRYHNFVLLKHLFNNPILAFHLQKRSEKDEISAETRLHLFMHN